MKKRLILLIVLVIVIGGVILAYMMIRNEEDKVLEEPNNNQEVEQSKEPGLEDESEENKDERVRIKVVFNDEELYVRLDDNDSSRDFVSLLPLTLDFEDYNNVEKIAYLPRDLTTENAPSGYTPQIGDFSYYVPWGNISIFYESFRYSNSLIKLGEFESGIEKLQNLNGDFKVTIDVVQ